MFTTFVALYVYSRVTSVLDASEYMSGALAGSDWMNRTLLVGNIAYPLAQMFGEIGAFLCFSGISAIGIWLLLVEFPEKIRGSVVLLFFLPTALAVPSSRLGSQFEGMRWVAF